MPRRVRISLLIGIVSGLFCWVGSRGRPEVTGWANRAGDFGWAILAAQDLWNGRDPYHRPFAREVVPYPIPAALLALPVSWLRHDLAGALFFGLSSALLAAGLLRKGNGALWVLFAYFPVLIVESLNGPPLTQSFSELRDRFISILSRSKFQE